MSFFSVHTNSLPSDRSTMSSRHMDFEGDALSEARKICGICVGSPRGSFQHYDEVHRICIITIKRGRNAEYEMAVPWMKEPATGKEGYHCPSCNARRNSRNALQMHISQEPCKKNKNRDVWFENELNHVQTCKVVHRGGFQTILERDEGGSFWCLGCGVGTPFPPTMQLHAICCEYRAPPSTYIARQQPEFVPSPVRPEGQPGSRVDPQIPGSDPTQEDEEMEVEDFIQSDPGPDFVQGSSRTGGDDGSQTRADSTVAKTPEVPSQPPTTSSRNLADIHWESCLPDEAVYTFVKGLPISSRSAYNIFNALAHCGVVGQGDLDTLSNVYQVAENQSQLLLTKRGMNLVEWYILRHALRNREPAASCTGSDRPLREFLSACVPSLSHHSAIFHSTCIHRLRDLQSLYTLTTEWNTLRVHLISQGFTFVEWLGLTRGLHILFPNPVNGSDLHTELDPSERRPRTVIELLKIIGLRSEADIDMLCVAQPEHMEQALDILSTQGASYSECKAVETMLKSRAETLQK
ncbi:hypothetical protein BXZ70DRAFT_301369 [Cristinia sonorae]|uniref:Uncharacterized protein n=1 Tax=Cristinia sonorae TaxID=1940300 RepID=A0A8K0UM44_9AGAR|nr:hypothetical protein BXZ70DRAFT_301369 [Cristinia sonorae]